MSRMVLRISCVVLALAVAGCLGGANQPYMAETGPVIQHTPGKALVNLHRTSMGAQARFPVWDRDTFVGFSMPATTIVYECDPGEHLFIVQAESPRLVRATLAADKIYDLMIEGKMGMRAARASMFPITADHHLRARLPLFDRIKRVRANPASAAGYEAADRPAVQRFLKGVDEGKYVLSIPVMQATDCR